MSVGVPQVEHDRSRGPPGCIPLRTTPVIYVDARHSPAAARDGELLRYAVQGAGRDPTSFLQADCIWGHGRIGEHVSYARVPFHFGGVVGSLHVPRLHNHWGPPSA